MKHFNEAAWADIDNKIKSAEMGRDVEEFFLGVVAEQRREGCVTHRWKPGWGPEAGGALKLTPEERFGLFLKAEKWE